MPDTLAALISQDAIAQAIQRLAQEIDRDYRDRSLVVVGVLKGSFIFLADLVRAIQTPIEAIEFMRFSSYGSATVSAGEARMIMNLSEEAVLDRHILLVEDIIDTGITTNSVMEQLKQYRVASLKMCALLDKPSRRQVPVAIDYLGFTVPDLFVVGYGIDFDEKYRQLPAIYTVEE
jgi:hypoxanthine phosphoribosyltransferase